MFNARYRRKRYHKLLEKYPLDVGGSSDVIHNLVMIWSKVRWGDYAYLPSDQRMVVKLVVGSSCLPQLLKWVERHNQCLTDDKTSVIERYNANPKPPRTITLDLYFADHEQREIDVGYYLRMLASQIMILHSHTRGEEGQYASRLSGYLYRELSALTIALLTIDKRGSLASN